MRRLTAAALAAAAVVALACKSGEATLDLEITASAGGRVAIVRTVDARTITDTVAVPYSHPFDAQQVVVQATAISGTVDCRITYGIKVLAKDADKRAHVASCTATRPDGAS
jgi:hypothetical protein